MVAIFWGGGLYFGKKSPSTFFQISAIFEKFRRKNWRFLKNQCYDQLFAYFSFVLSQKRQFFRRSFRRKYLKNHKIGPRFYVFVSAVIH
jgi:hypothetical protein